MQFIRTTLLISACTLFLSTACSIEVDKNGTIEAKIESKEVFNQAEKKYLEAKDLYKDVKKLTRKDQEEVKRKLADHLKKLEGIEKVLNNQKELSKELGILVDEIQDEAAKNGIEVELVK